LVTVPIVQGDEAETVIDEAILDKKSTDRGDNSVYADVVKSASRTRRGMLGGAQEPQIQLDPTFARNNVALHDDLRKNGIKLAAGILSWACYY